MITFPRIVLAATASMLMFNAPVHSTSLFEAIMYVLIAAGVAIAFFFSPPMP